MSVKSFLKRIIPKTFLNLRHLWYAKQGAKKYGYPSEELLVIGVTGTSGKSTTIWLLRQLLEVAGYTVGSLSTIDFYIAGKSQLNDKKMTMLGKMEIQTYLRKMVDAGCDVAIIETTSEGRLQHRHRYINYDTMILTNLYPEHIEAHGSFQKYKQAKLDIFLYVAKSKRKMFDGKNIPKTAIIKRDLEEREEFLSDAFDQKITFGQGGDYAARDVRVTKNGLHFLVNDRTLDAPMYGAYNVENILAVIAMARSLDIDWKTIERAIQTFQNVPGRIEFIRKAEMHGFQAIVDYAFEPKAMAELYKVVDLLQPTHVIHVFGSTGGGRDVSRRFSVGQFVGTRADVCIITDEDPYDDDPMNIMRDVASAVKKTGKREGEDMFVIRDRKEAIQKAVGIAKKGDLILVTGKGSEQAMVVGDGRKIPWDDRVIVQKEIEKRKN